MNAMAGLADNAIEAPEREARLRAALATDDEVTVIHPLPGVSLAFHGNSPLVGHARLGHLQCVVYGGCHGAESQDAPACRVDDPAGAATSLLVRYMRDPLRFLAGLSGSFVSLVFDEGTGSLLAFADPGGTRSLFAGERAGALSWATHPLCCARVLGEPRLDRNYEDVLLVYGFLPDGRTVYRDVRALPAGEALMWRSGAVERQAIEAPPVRLNDPSLLSDVDSLSDMLLEEVLACLEEQLPSDDEVGVLLGGFDSALVASLLHRLGKKVRTYSFFYEDAEYNQPHTDTLARFLGCEHRWVRITPDVIARGLETYAASASQPTNWMNYVIQTKYVCERMRDDGLRFAWSGDGCDAIFLGYPGTYQRTKIFSLLPHLPDHLVSLMLRVGGRRVLDRHVGHPYRMALNLLRATRRAMPARAFLTFRVLDELSLAQLRGDDVPPQAESVEEVADRLARGVDQVSIQRLGYLAKSLVSPNKAKLCASTDASGVQIFAPYLHPRLKAFAARIPDRMLREESQSSLKDPGKICLMRMAEKHGLLPHEVIHQPKLAAIDSPIDRWIERELNAPVMRMMQRLPFRADARFVKSLLRTTPFEGFYKRRISSTRVLSDGASLLATYAAFAGAAARDE